MKRTVIRSVYILVIAVVVGLYAFNIIVNHAEPTKHLLRTISIVCLCIAGLIRTIERKRNTLKYYENKFQDILTHAFSDQPIWHKKLLCAVRLYCEDQNGKSIKYLTDLREKCRHKEDFYAVYLFAALSFTDMRLLDHAENAYNTLIHNDIADSRIFSNLGHVQLEAGKYDRALINFNHALDYDRKNDKTYNNIAQTYFKMHQFEEAIPYALKALEINPSLHNASSLLAIIYALQEDKTNAEKYFHMAISSGRDPKELKDSIEYYRSAQFSADEKSEENDAETEEINE